MNKARWNKDKKRKNQIATMQASVVQCGRPSNNNVQPQVRAKAEDRKTKKIASIRLKQQAEQIEKDTKREKNSA